MDPESDGAVLQILRQGVWFGGLPPALQALILERSVVRSYRKGAFIIREGAPPKAMFALLDGQVHVLRQVGNGDEFLIHVGEAGSWFGEYAVYAAAPSIGSVVAASPVRALMLPAQQFERIVDEEPRHFRHFANLLMEHFAYLFRYMAEAHGLVPEDWLCIRLADLAVLQRHHRPAEGPVDLTISQSDLANMIGVSRQTLNALLARLQTRGLIEVGFRRIRVLDEARLRSGPGCLQGSGAIRPTDSPRPHTQGTPPRPSGPGP